MPNIRKILYLMACINVRLCCIPYIKEERSLIFSGIHTAYHFINYVGDLFSVVNNISSHIKKETRKEGRWRGGGREEDERVAQSRHFPRQLLSLAIFLSVRIGFIF